MNPMRPRIAIVDDENSVRKALERLLRSAGLDVESFSSGQDFLDADESSVDCLVLDLHMPNLSGFDVLQELDRRSNKLAVIVVTGHDTPEARARVLAGGAAAYLLKPVNDEVLLEAIVTATARHLS
jgi:FixJ family two-component response regulator